MINKLNTNKNNTFQNWKLGVDCAAWTFCKIHSNIKSVYIKRGKLH